ncbi:hypothetical protein [Microbacterium sp. PMB16]|uniref:hypothetical protein n=1 Tax=Microbacterium sp. PMB16 TaxID=3120157 RepID=UPI003F4B7E96
MSLAPASTRTHVHIDGHDFLLAPGQDLVDLRNRIEDAAHSAGMFVHFQTPGRLLSVLISAANRVIISVDIESSTDPPPVTFEFMIPEWEY